MSAQSQQEGSLSTPSPVEYSPYKYSFSPDLDHYRRMLAVRRWAKVKMVKWLASGDTVRFRSVAFDENRFFSSNNTNILKTPLILSQKQVQNRRKSLQK